MNPENTTPRNVAILIFDDMETLDFAGPREVFTLASEQNQPSPFHVYEVGLTAAPILARGRLRVTPSHGIDDCPDPDILIVPGGYGTRHLKQNEGLLKWIAAQAARVELLMSVCTGSLVLAKAGLLAGKRATTHHSAFGRLAVLSPTTTVVRDERFVESSDRIMTAGGISAGIDLSLFVVEKLLGEKARAAVEDEMEYGWFFNPKKLGSSDRG
jgi:transcriptional regulator GlxA family with amidase domain